MSTPSIEEAKEKVRDWHPDCYPAAHKVTRDQKGMFFEWFTANIYMDAGSQVSIGAACWPSMQEALDNAWLNAASRLSPAVSFADEETAAMHRAQALQNTDCPAPALPEQASEAPLCLNVYPIADAWLCDSKYGHEGAHTKHFGEYVQTWVNVPNPAIATEGEAMATEYRIVREEHGCPHGTAGGHLLIVNSEDVPESTPYDDEDHAQDICDMLNQAFERGRNMPSFNPHESRGETRARKVENELLDNDDDRTSHMRVDSDSANSNSAGYFEKDVARPKPHVEKDAMQVLDEDERQAFAYIRTFPGFAQAKDEEIKREFSQWLIFRSERNAAVRELLAYKSASPNPHEGERSDATQNLLTLIYGYFQGDRDEVGLPLKLAVRFEDMPLNQPFRCGRYGSVDFLKVNDTDAVAAGIDYQFYGKDRMCWPVAHSADAGGAEQVTMAKTTVQTVLAELRSANAKLEQKAAELKEARQIMAEAETALRTSYNVRDYPADGDTDQDRASSRIQRFLNP